MYPKAREKKKKTLHRNQTRKKWWSSSPRGLGLDLDLVKELTTKVHNKNSYNNKRDWVITATIVAAATVRSNGNLGQEVCLFRRDKRALVKTWSPLESLLLLILMISPLKPPPLLVISHLSTLVNLYAKFMKYIIERPFETRTHERWYILLATPYFWRFFKIHHRTI